MAVVTNGYQTTNQQTAFVGQFAPVPGTGNWQRYTWVPLIDSSGNLIKFDPSQYHTNSDGSLTLRYASGGGYNANFIMLVPADTTLPVVANLYPDGLMQFEHTNTLSFAANSSLGIPTNNISVKLNGVDVSSSLVITGPSTNRQVSYSQLAGDTIYSAIITVKILPGRFTLSRIVLTPLTPITINGNPRIGIIRVMEFQGNTLRIKLALMPICQALKA